MLRSALGHEQHPTTAGLGAGHGDVDVSSDAADLVDESGQLRGRQLPGPVDAHPTEQVTDGRALQILSVREGGDLVQLLVAESAHLGEDSSRDQKLDALM